MWEAKNLFWTTSRRSLLAAVAPRSAEYHISIEKGTIIRRDTYTCSCVLSRRQRGAFSCHLPTLQLRLSPPRRRRVLGATQRGWRILTPSCRCSRLTWLKVFETLGTARGVFASVAHGPEHMRALVNLDQLRPQSTEIHPTCPNSVLLSPPPLVCASVITNKMDDQEQPPILTLPQEVLDRIAKKVVVCVRPGGGMLEVTPEKLALFLKSKTPPI